MKKILLYSVLLLIMSTPVSAETMAVESLTTISTEAPNKIIKVKVLKDCTLADIELKRGYVLEGKILSVTDPKRLKRDATFTFFPMNYENLNGEKFHISVLYVGTYTPRFEINAGQVAKGAALTVGSHFVKGLSTGYYAVEGAVENKEGNIVKSAAENVYENSVFSYTGKGQQLKIEPETCFGLKFDDCVNKKDEE